MPTAFVESLDQAGRGVAHVDGKAIFIDGALPGEQVIYSPYLKKPTYELAQLSEVQRAGAARVIPHCAHYGVCGGCALQHADWRVQVAAKQRVLEDNLARIGKVEVDHLLAPIYGTPSGYRHRARLSVRYVKKKDSALVGFREKKGGYVAQMESCANLAPPADQLIMPLRQLFGSLQMREAIPQVEVIVADNITILLLRVLEDIGVADAQKLRRFAEEHQVHLWQQRGGMDTVQPVFPLPAITPNYFLPEFGLRYEFGPTEFTQVNFALNRVLVARAVQLMQVREGENIVDVFCGLGNFALALAARGAEVLGLEGSDAMVRRARENAERNGLAQRARFAVADLYADLDAATLARLRCDKMLLDPPRDGALQIVSALTQQGPRRIVYVSCNPATLARDASVLVHDKGYRLACAGVINMFPHTAHVESIALFEKTG